ncbi:MAG: S-methyl-5'-thioadenosine phosphorylase [Thermoplasmataceae archaeon]
MIGIIGGSGIYNLLTEKKSLKIDTPYGQTSSEIQTGIILGKEVAFIPRHGNKHNIPPHKVNYRANIWALNKVGCAEILGINAVGSLKEKIEPGDTVIPDQFIDFTKRRELTFYDGPEVVHISTADPFCSRMNNIIGKIAKKEGKTHIGGTYVVIEGPRFSTRAESMMFRNYGDIIGMTLVPEINLADELGMCYSMLATVTDYDVWSEKPVEVSEVIKIIKENEEKTMKNIEMFVRENTSRNCECHKRLENARL